MGLEHLNMMAENKEMLKMGIVEKSHRSQLQVVRKEQSWNNLTNK